MPRWQLCGWPSSACRLVESICRSLVAHKSSCLISPNGQFKTILQVPFLEFRPGLDHVAHQFTQIGFPQVIQRLRQAADIAISADKIGIVGCGL